MTNVTQKQKFFLRWVENIVGKGENAVNLHFLLQKAVFYRVVKSQGKCGKELKKQSNPLTLS